MAENVNAMNMFPGSFGSNRAPFLSQGYERGVQPMSDKYATYLKLFSGELFKAYQDAQVAKGTVTTRTLRNGKSMQFIFTGGLDSQYHTPGTPILGSGTRAGADGLVNDADGNVPGSEGYTTTYGPNQANSLPVAEKTVICDDLLIASTFVYNLDEVFAHYDLRGEIARKLAYALANRYDQNIFKTIAQASREGAVGSLEGQKGGNVLYLGNNQENNSERLVQAFYRAATIFDENNIPANGRVAVLCPEQYYSLITQVSQNIISPINRDETGTAVKSGEWGYQIAGIQIRKSNNVKKGKFDHVQAAGENNEYRVTGADGAGNGAGTCGLIYHKDSCAVVEAVGPQVQTTSGDVSVMYQGDLIVGKVSMGAGTLNPAGAISLQAGAAVSAGNGTQHHVHLDGNNNFSHWENTAQGN